MRKQVGQIDAGLLAQVDALAVDRGQTRRVVVERALEAVLRDAEGARSSMQSGPAPVPSSDGVRPAAQPRTHGEGRNLMSELKASLDQPGLRVNGHLLSCKCWRCEKEQP